MQRTTIHLGEPDRRAIEVIKDRFGVATDSDAIRLALRVLAEAKEIGLSPLPIPEQRGRSESKRHAKKEEGNG